jgi:hypothetical protein
MEWFPPQRTIDLGATAESPALTFLSRSGSRALELVKRTRETILCCGSDGMLCFYLNGLPRAQLADRRAMGFIANTGEPTDAVNGWYLMGGYRLQKWTPYLIYSNSHQNQAAGGAVPEMNGPTESAGVRWDVFKSADLKAQFDHAKAFDYGTPFINTQPHFNNKANIFSLAADFVF